MVTKTINDIYSKLIELEETMIKKKDLSSYLDSIEILSNEETMNSFKESKNDICSNDIEKVNSFNDLIK